MTFPPRRLLALVLAVASITAGCIDTAPVTELLTIAFRPDGSMEAAAVTKLASGTEVNAARGAGERLARARDAISHREDTWARAFDRLQPEIQRESFEYRRGLLTEARREIAVKDPNGLPGIFESAPLAATFTTEEGVAVLRLVPTEGSLAGSAEARSVREALDRFSRSASAYLKMVGELYAYLDEHPERARACFANMFKAEPGEEMNEREEELISDLGDRMSDLVEVMTLPEGEAYTLNEKSHLLYDPFPSPIQIELPAAPVEVRGFERASETVFTARGPGFWEALGGLDRGWIDPDPVMIVSETVFKDPPPPVDVEGLVSRGWRARDLPDEAAFKAALIARLRPADEYLLRWKVPAAVPTPGGGERPAP